MNVPTARSLGVLAALALGAALVLGGRGAAAQSAATPVAATGCTGWDVEYALAGNLEISDTLMGQGDGIYPIGPGSLVVRFDDHDGQPGGAAKVVAYEMRQRFTVTSKMLFWKTTVTNDALTRGLFERCGPTEGALRGPFLEWATPVRNFKTDATVNCEGSFCGSFGAPPPGQSALHLGPNPVDFKPFQFSADHKTFTMASTFVAHTDSPKQTSHLALSGREVRRTCQPKTCN